MSILHVCKELFNFLEAAETGNLVMEADIVPIKALEGLVLVMTFLVDRAQSPVSTLNHLGSCPCFTEWTWGFGTLKWVIELGIGDLNGTRKLLDPAASPAHVLVLEDVHHLNHFAFQK